MRYNMVENIYTAFKNELGYATASIQYVELVCRIAKSKHEEELLPLAIQDKARKYGLSVSTLNDDIENRIAKNYIVQIHSCVEKFLNNYKRLVGSSTYGMEWNAKEDNLLHWTLVKALGDCGIEYKDLYRVCDYYRLLRNDIIHHDDKTSSALRIAYSSIKNNKPEKLNAPNFVDAVCFDDQVYFARSAKQLMEIVFYNGKYDWNEIIQDKKKEILSFIGSCKHDPVKVQKKVDNYLRRMYPVPEEGINGLAGLL